MFPEKIFKAYDIRGIYPEELNDDLAYKIGQGYVDFVKPEGKVAVGMDARLSSPALKKAVIKGLVDAGIEVIDLGLISTEMIYFAVGYYKFAGGIQVTASHNPKEYGGFKMVRENAIPLFGEEGIYQIRDFAKSCKRIEVGKPGSVVEKDILADFATYALTYINPQKIKSMKVVYNPNFGFEGEVLKKVIEIGNLPLKIVGLNEKPDGNFPKGRPDPYVPENRPEFVDLVKSTKADLGVAWDADADRVFFCANDGTFVDPYFMNAVFTKYFLEKFPNSTVLYEPRYTWAIIDTARQNDGKAIAVRVGHSYIKAGMRKYDAIFCGESSGHTYLRDFYYADSGIIPLLMVLEMISSEGKTLLQIVKPYLDKYFISGEINNKVEDTTKVMAEIEEEFSDAKITKLDGLSIEYSNWRANIRTSNTEPLLRLNIEAKSEELMIEKRDKILNIIRK